MTEVVRLLAANTEAAFSDPHAITESPAAKRAQRHRTSARPAFSGVPAAAHCCRRDRTRIRPRTEDKNPRRRFGTRNSRGVSLSLV
jgi:hypothetical protein